MNKGTIGCLFKSVYTSTTMKYKQMITDVSNGRLARNLTGNLVQPKEYEGMESELSSIQNPAEGSSFLAWDTLTLWFWNGDEWVTKEA